MYVSECVSGCEYQSGCVESVLTAMWDREFSIPHKHLENIWAVTDPGHTALTQHHHEEGALRQEAYWCTVLRWLLQKDKQLQNTQREQELTQDSTRETIQELMPEPPQDLNLSHGSQEPALRAPVKHLAILSLNTFTVMTHIWYPSLMQMFFFGFFYPSQFSVLYYHWSLSLSLIINHTLIISVNHSLAGFQVSDSYAEPKRL